MKNNYCVIMAGGVGTRFWPLSTTEKPKQFHDILNTGETFIQQTFRRLTKIAPKQNIVIVTNHIYKDLINEQLPDLEENQILYEPSMRDTAPCIAYACYKINQKNKDANILVAPSDHLILNEDEFCRIALDTLNFAGNHSSIITLGITPTNPNTGYGYIQYNEDDSNFKDVKTFTEKPNKEIAESFLESGDFLWNAGIFIWSAKTIIEAFKTYLPDDHEWFTKGEEFYNTPKEQNFINNIYEYTSKISIDYGILEKATNVKVVPSSFGWSDIGTWGSMYENTPKDENNNAVKARLFRGYNAKNNVIHSTEDKIVVIQGLNNFIIVENENALLICPRAEEQEIKTIVKDLKTNNKTQKLV